MAHVFGGRAIVPSFVERRFGRRSCAKVAARTSGALKGEPTIASATESGAENAVNSAMLRVA